MASSTGSVFSPSGAPGHKWSVWFHIANCSTARTGSAPAPTGRACGAGLFRFGEAWPPPIRTVRGTVRVG